MKAVLNTLITELTNNYKNRLEKLQPLMVLFPPLKPLDNDARSAISELSKLSSGGLLDDIDGFETEFDIFVTGLSKDEAETMQTLKHVAEHSCKLRHVFPLVYRAYNLTLCAPVSAAKNERSLNRLKIVKNFQRSKCSDDRLDSLMLLYCEADITMDLNLDSLGKD